MKEKKFDICSITGLELTTCLDWIDTEFASGYSVSYKIIDKRILLCEAAGSGSLEGLKQSLAFASKIITDNFENKPFIYIEDFAKVASPTTEGRKYYIQFMKGLKNMKSIIYYNVNPFMSLSIKLAQKLNFFGFDVHVTKQYSDAINLALNALNIKKEQKTIAQNKLIVKTGPDWDLKFKDYSIRFEVVNGNILHVVSKGIFKIEHFDAVFKFHDNFIKDNFQDKLNNYYYVVNLNAVTIARNCRKEYIKKIQLIYNNRPFKSYIYYGASRLLNIAIVFGVSLVNFDVKKMNDFNAVLDFTKKNEIKKTKKNKKISNETQSYIDEFLAFLGQIDWEDDRFNKNFKKDEIHPFYQVYDAITLIKSDLDELYLERKKNEEENAILQHKLQQSLKLETMGKLAGSVAHDLNNVLSGIVSYPDIILKELPLKKENEKAVKYIRRMKKSGQKAADIVQDLLTLSRSGVVSFELVNLNFIIEEYIRSPELKNLWSTKPNISIECSLDKNLSNISASAIHLSKTIMNLITNAVEAISNDGKIKITTKNKSFKNKKFKGYDQKADGNYVELIVSDTGSGISEQDLPKIFEPFYSKKVMGRSGTGLGMIVIKGTIDDHNGFIQINSNEGKGSEFILYFPINKERLNKKFVQKMDNYTGKGESILIIDDDEDQRIIAYKILKGLYYSVKTLSSGEEAIEYLKKETADLIVLDMIMSPGIGGLETFKQIKKINPNQKAIIVSGFSATYHVDETQKLGAGKYIKKPYAIENIGIAIYEELKKST